jgi:hypothetical protein
MPTTVCSSSPTGATPAPICSKVAPHEEKRQPHLVATLLPVESSPGRHGEQLRTPQEATLRALGSTAGSSPAVTPEQCKMSSSGRGTNMVGGSASDCIRVSMLEGHKRGRAIGKAGGRQEERSRRATSWNSIAGKLSMAMAERVWPR